MKSWKKKAGAFLFHKVLGWKADVTFPHRNKCIICVAPHTSNLDFFVARLYYTSIGQHANFLMKEEWFFWPLGILLRRMGGIPVKRDKKTHLTDRLAQLASQSKEFELAITPEGTRSLCKEWKRGFYFIALKAGLPIQLYGLDYKHKTIVGKSEIWPTGDVENDMRLIRHYFKDFQGRHPEKFSIGDD